MINGKENERCKVSKIEFNVEEVSPVKKLQRIFLVLTLLLEKSSEIFSPLYFLSIFFGLWIYDCSLDRDLLLTKSL
jgi:hypothetical protein